MVAARMRGAVNGVGVLGVDDHEGVEGLELGHVLLHLVRFEVGEFVHAGVEQEALEAEDALVVQRAEVRLVARHGAAPESDVHERLVFGHFALELEAFHRGGGRDGVQRHVDDGGDAAGGGGARGGGEALPLGAAGLVDVDVRVHKAGDEGFVVGQFNDLGAGEAVAERLDGDDHAVADAYFAGGDACGGEDAPAADDQVKRASRRGGFFRHGRSPWCRYALHSRAGARRCAYLILQAAGLLQPYISLHWAQSRSGRRPL